MFVYVKCICIYVCACMCVLWGERMCVCVCQSAREKLRESVSAFRSSVNSKRVTKNREKETRDKKMDHKKWIPFHYIFFSSLEYKRKKQTNKEKDREQNTSLWILTKTQTFRSGNKRMRRILDIAREWRSQGSNKTIGHCNGHYLLFLKMIVFFFFFFYICSLSTVQSSLLNVCNQTGTCNVFFFFII